MRAVPLTFERLSDVSAARAERWTVGHPDTPLSFHATELGGEAGEVLNDIKKLERLRMGLPGGKDTSENLAGELADVVICADILARKLGIDLGEAVRSKFNEVSERHEFPERL